jgi:signal transduction histidine kinase
MKTISGDFSGEDFFPEIPCFISIHNNQMQVVAANDSYQERFSESRGSGSWRIYKDVRKDGSDSPVGLVLAGESIGSRNHVAVAADGSEVPVCVYAMPVTNVDGTVELVIEMAVDVTAVRTLQNELRETQRKFQRLFDESPCYITVQDRNLCIVEANKRFKEDFEFGSGHFCFEAYKKRLEPCNDCPITKTFEDGQSHHAETVVTSKTGAQHNILLWTAPLKDSLGNITHVMEIATNITMIRDLQDNITSLGIMLGSMSHGIKGLLTAMDGGAYLVNKALQKGDLEGVRTGWEMIRVRIDRIRKMVWDILFYSKPRELEISSIELREFSKEMASIAEERAGKANVSFVRDIDGSNRRFEADSVALSSALVNFLENAFDACEVDRSKTQHQVSFSAKIIGESVHFVISDNGIGMDEETKNRMFTLFFSSKESRGTGIGLFVSNHVVRQHFGKVSVESELGTGTTVKVQVPIRKPLDSMEWKDLTHAH